MASACFTGRFPTDWGRFLITCENSNERLNRYNFVLREWHRAAASDALATFVSVTPRTFARQFDAYFRTTPGRWVQSLRIEAVCMHLVTGQLPLKAIAKIKGFRDEHSLRRAFHQQLLMTPKEYRRRFGASRWNGWRPVSVPSNGSLGERDLVLA
jgi:transcriptional regulator GlxA family with amidase domain